MRFSPAVVAASAILAGACRRPAEAEPASPPPVPPPAKTEASLALRKLRVAPGLKVELFAAEPQLVNPVAFCIDERGRFYVAETHRFNTPDSDIRRHMEWLEEDLALRTVAERAAFLTRVLGPKAREFAEPSEVLRRIEDTDGDGRADRSVVFADGFRGLATGIAAGVLARGDEVWATVYPTLWRLRDADGDGKADTREPILDGFGVHVGYDGHDLHGLCFGPDGKLYFTMGDRGMHVETGGRTIDSPNQGGVLRCNPDGSELELYATGMRNPQKLAFDAYGNLWTGENNADFGDRARWVYVVEGADCGWRNAYQYLPAGGPWLSEGLWEGKALYILPPIGFVGHGPSGLVFYPGVGLPPRYDDHFLLCDFPGGVLSFAVRPKGAAYELTDLQTFLWELLPSDVAFGPDGAVYVSDWVEGWKMPQKGRIFRVFDPELRKNPAVLEVKRLLAEGMAGKAEAELAAFLGHRDQRVRLAAQFELAGRGAAALPVFARAAKGEEAKGSTRPDLARLHGIWGLGQIEESAPEAMNVLLELLKAADAEVRAQAAKVLGEGRSGEAYGDLLSLLKDPSPRVRFFAALGVGKTGGAGRRGVYPERERREGAPGDAAPALLDMLRDNADRDAYLRHAGVMALAWIGDVEALERAAKDKSASVRLAVLLAMRRLKRPEIATFLDDADPALVYESGRAIHDVPIDDAMPALAAVIVASGPPHPPPEEAALQGRRVERAEAALPRAINARFRLGRHEDAAALAAYAAKPAAPGPMRAEALKALAAWGSPPKRDRVTGFWRPLPERDAGAARDALRPALTGILREAPDAVRIEAARAAAALGMVEDAAEPLAALARDRGAAPDVRAEALRALVALSGVAKARTSSQDATAARIADAVAAALDDPDETVRREGIRLVPRTRLPDAPARLERAAAEEGSVPLRQAALIALGELEGAPSTALGASDADGALARLLDRFLAGRLPAALHYDLLEAAAKRSSPAVRDRLERQQAARPKDDPLGGYRELLDGGAPLAGRDIFYRRGVGECRRCHRIKILGGEVGPPLTSIGAVRTKTQLLESILFPNREIAPGYEQAVVVTTDEITHVGRVDSETGDALVLRTPEGRRVHIAKGDIQSRTRGLSAMPEDYGRLLTRRELRDLVAFLALGKGNPQAEPLEEGAVLIDNDEPFWANPLGNWREATAEGDCGWTHHWAPPDPRGASKLLFETTLPKPGRYRVLLWPGGGPTAGRATDAPFTVQYDGGEETFRVDLTRGGGAWRPLGTFPFGTTNPARVTLSNDANGVVVGDAVKFVPE